MTEEEKPLHTGTERDNDRVRRIRELLIEAYSPHLSLRVLAKYSRKRLDEKQTATVEEHLLICGDCRELLTRIEESARRLRRLPDTK